MKKWSILIFAGLVLIGSALYAMGEKPEESASGSWRYKMTVVVETPGGIKSGSAVREVSNTVSSIEMGTPESTSPAELRGEAVVVDLGERGVLFALLKGLVYGENYAGDLPFYVFPSGVGYSTVEGVKYYDSLEDRKATLTLNQYPLLVAFKDLDDPKTVTPVLEGEVGGIPARRTFNVKANHFEELFGEGVKLKEIIIEMTDEPVTWGIDGYLKWLPQLEGGYLHGGFTSREAPLGLHGGNFHKNKK